jgi:hypothetical protein
MRSFMYDPLETIHTKTAGRDGRTRINLHYRY